MDLKNKKILVTGGAGFLGSYVIKELIKQGVSSINIIVPRSRQLDLRIPNNCLKVTKNVEIIIHLAGNVGGIGKNQKYPATLFYDNALMGIHLIDAAAKAKVEKLVILGTICSYPKYTPAPFREAHLWQGFPDETNAPYGIAKKMLLVACQAYKKQFGLNSIYLLPVNLYGPGDNFNPDSSHVIPALIHKIHEAIIKNQSPVVVWGDGSPTREFLYVKDAARAVVLATMRYNKLDPVNLGSGYEISIKDLVLAIAKIMKFNGEILWDTAKPNGQPKRLLDTAKAKMEFDFRAQIPFEKGLKSTIDWYLKSYGQK